MKNIIFTLIFLISLPVFGGIFDKKIKQYQCKNSEIAHSCSSCQSTEFYEKGKLVYKIEYQFKVDKEQNRVMKIVYDMNKVTSSDYLDNCKVSDNKNWICTYKGGWSTISEKMVNGIYVSIYESKNDSLTGYFCAK